MMEEENAFIERLKGLFGGQKHLVGIGDDCSVIPWKEDQVLLVTKDMLVEDVHFRLKTCSPRDLGHKTAQVNLSDVAAMGGTPLYGFLGMALPQELPTLWAQEFLSGLKESLETWGVLVLGGDTTRSPDRVVVDLTLLGQMEASKVKLRSGSRPGDVVAVTGFLGDSGGGLRLLEEGLTDDHHHLLIQRHLRPRAQVAEGRWLAQFAEVNAMMDVSDGIDIDLVRFSDGGRVAFTIDLDLLPLSPELRGVGKEKGWNLPELAATGGEDYCLLVSVQESHFDQLRGKFLETFGHPLFPLGKVVEGPGTISYRSQGKPRQLERRGYQHFQG